MDDVIIVGAGPAGALAATILARVGARVRVFDRARFPRPKLCGDTLNPGALRVLADHLPLAPLIDQSLPLEGMLLTGPGGVSIRGRYPRGLVGRSISRRVLDAMLIDCAANAGAAIEDSVTVTAPIVDPAKQTICGVVVSGHRGSSLQHRAPLVIAADGRSARMARALGLVRAPSRPRRWAIGAYFDDVEEMSAAGEMHVRDGHYIGVAPLPGGLTNACLVVPHESAGRAWRDPAARLTATLRSDRRLAPRFARARLVEGPLVLGPMAVDTVAAGAPGLLLAGDAAGFIDPMTGDGLRLALTSAVLAAEVAGDVLAGHIELSAAASRLASKRHASFAAKWRFNRTIRALVTSANLVSAAAFSARVIPAVFESIIRYAGDCHLADYPDSVDFAHF